jgi:carboxyl-terminal processing protease
MSVSLLLMLLIGGVPRVAGRETEPAVQEDVYKQIDLFEHALSIVLNDYVEEPKAQQLMYGALKGMLATLDPYSQFMDPDSYNELKVDTGGEFGGLGIEITIKDELLTVIAPIDDTPAYHAGLMSGDRIVKIDGELTRGITLMEAVKKLRGKPNTDVKLTLLHEGDSELKEVTLTRAIVKIQSVREAGIIEDHIGYVRISDFRENTAEELEKSLKELKQADMDGLIVDLRNNPGGLLDVSVSVAELFLERQQLVVTTKGRLENQNQELRARVSGLVNSMPLVILINEGSASASEIVAGAIQDHHRGVIMGAKSHGKASVQTIFPLKDGSALRLTTSKYFTPLGRSIHGEGIHPDVPVAFERPSEEKTKPNEAEQVFGRVESEPPSDTAKPPAEPALEGKFAPPKDSLQEKKQKDNQLARAVDLLKGLKVYQGQEKERQHARRS